MKNPNALLSESLILELTEYGGPVQRIIIPDNSSETVKIAIEALQNEHGYLDSYCKDWEYDGYLGSYHDGARWARMSIEIIRIQSLKII